MTKVTLIKDIKTFSPSGLGGDYISGKAGDSVEVLEKYIARGERLGIFGDYKTPAKPKSAPANKALKGEKANK